MTASIRDRARQKFLADTSAAQGEHQNQRKTATARHRREHHDALTALEAGRWEHTTLFETAEKGANEARVESKARLARLTQALQELHKRTQAVQSRYRGFLAANPPVPEPEAGPRNPRPA